MSKEHLREPKSTEQEKPTEYIYWRDPSLPAGYDPPSEDSDEPPEDESWPDDEERYLGGFFD